MTDLDPGLNLPRWKRVWLGIDSRTRLRERRGRTSRRCKPGQRGNDSARFFREWLRNPVATAAVAPSGDALVALITREIGGWTGPVLELGPGTGVFTRALIARGVEERNLTLVERNPAFAQLLRERHPHASILVADAGELQTAIGADVSPFGAVVCGLGLRNMKPALIEAILSGAFARMRPGAAFYLFTYGRRCSVPGEILDRLGLHARRIGIAYRNLPPASVFRLTRS
ncbi:hypothetical protein COC42_03200 [Sphingomonas spermidinifaciens]|uniref:Methyltransferase domain-containing protein n=1 Tax=Sphingomonas spermidinifaciens TaxID=1141889 RepID=A0A2A4B636_9SPHN|nr:methyltransferase domain-containing protein [Sphingomonas spermidinifaciens]PCD03412.1 hypothetical protein COC42_03200 [Sphingomonas spermidinifaciens]